MKLTDMIIMCISNLFKRKIRTLLTVAGVVIGTCAIVVMVSLGLGIKESMDAMMQGMGDLTVITINNYTKNPDAQPLDDSMLESIKKMEHVVAVTPSYNAVWEAQTIKSGKLQYNGQIIGVYMDALQSFGYEVLDGALPQGKVPEAAVLFGEEAVYNFMNPKKKNQSWGMTTNPDGTPKEPDVNVMKDKLELTINLKEGSTAKKKPKPVKLTCLGVLKSDWSKTPTPYGVFMDIKYLKEIEKEYNKLNGIKTDRNKKEEYDTAVVKTDNIKNVAEIEEAIKALGYTTYSMESVRKPLEEQSRTIQMILGSLGAISLLVAALGIINTMTMSIYERTREIGVMKVLGCVIGNIRAMFLMEAATIGLMGGIVGVGLSYAASFILNTFVAQGGGGGALGGMFGMGANGGQISVIPIWLVIGALIFATLVGLVSGLYPANRAVRISALAAIKQE